MSGEKKDGIDLGDLPPGAADASDEELNDEALDKVSGGLSIRRGSSPRAPSKSGLYIPAPPAAQVPVPYPPGM